MAGKDFRRQIGSPDGRTQPHCLAAFLGQAGGRDRITKYAILVDRFADNGLVAEVVGEIVGEALHIRLMLMSCRVLKRGLEDALMNCLVEDAKEKGLKWIYGYYYPTAKNTIVSKFFENYGFNMIENVPERVVYVLDINTYQEIATHMVIND